MKTIGLSGERPSLTPRDTPLNVVVELITSTHKSLRSHLAKRKKIPIVQANSVPTDVNRWATFGSKEIILSRIGPFDFSFKMNLNTI